MKLNAIIALLVLSVFPFSNLASAEVNGSLKLKDIPTDGDTSITVKKGVIKEIPDFEVVNGVDEIAGDPEAGNKEAYNSWKAACNQWKKDTKELNKENQVLALNCNLPSVSRQKDGLTTYHSTGTYKLKVRIRDKAN